MDLFASTYMTNGLHVVQVWTKHGTTTK